MELLSSRPITSAPKAFPSAARANRALFFVAARTRRGRVRLRPMTLAEVRGRIDAMIDRRATRYANMRLDLWPELATVAE